MAQTQNGPVDDNTRNEPKGTRSPRLTVGKGKEISNHPKLLEVPARLQHRTPDEVQQQPSEDPDDSAWNLLFKKGDASTLDLNSEVPPTSKKNVNQPNIFTLNQGEHSSFVFVS